MAATIAAAKKFLFLVQVRHSKQMEAKTKTDIEQFQLLSQTNQNNKKRSVKLAICSSATENYENY